MTKRALKEQLEECISYLSMWELENESLILSELQNGSVSHVTNLDTHIYPTDKNSS